MADRNLANIHQFNSESEFSDAAASFIVARAVREYEKKRFFTVALSGGSSPAPVYHQIATQYRMQMPWRYTYFFFSDERCVPAESPDSNFKMARNALLHLPEIDESSIIRPKTAILTPEECAHEYENKIVSFFRNRGMPPQIDLVILGMGGDGHIASLFPGNEVLFESSHLVRAVKENSVPHDRITFTIPMILRAQNVMFIVSGNKQKMFGTVKKSDSLPAAIVMKERPTDWFIYFF